MKDKIERRASKLVLDRNITAVAFGKIKRGAFILNNVKTQKSNKYLDALIKDYVDNDFGGITI